MTLHHRQRPPNDPSKWPPLGTNDREWGCGELHFPLLLTDDIFSYRSGKSRWEKVVWTTWLALNGISLSTREIPWDVILPTFRRSTYIDKFWMKIETSTGKRQSWRFFCNMMSWAYLRHPLVELSRGFWFKRLTREISNRIWVVTKWREIT